MQNDYNKTNTNISIEWAEFTFSDVIRPPWKSEEFYQGDIWRAETILTPKQNTLLYMEVVHGGEI